MIIIIQVLFEGSSSSSSALFGSPPGSSAQAPQYRRGWQRVKASLPTTSRLRRTRSSLGPSPSTSQSPTESEVAGPSAGSGNPGGSSSLRRVSSNGILPNILSDAFSAEPEDIGGRNNDTLDDVAEGDEEEEDGEFEDGELAEWARRDRFTGDVLGETASVRVRLRIRPSSISPQLASGPSYRLTYLRNYYNTSLHIHRRPTGRHS